MPRTRKAKKDDLDYGVTDNVAIESLPAKSQRPQRKKKGKAVETQAPVPEPMLNEDENEDTVGDMVDNTVESPPAKSQKRTRQKKGVDSEPEEKRQARVRNHCPKNIEERVARVKNQRFYMIERERLDSAMKETFKVLGSTGNVYTVIISHLPTCDCPDARKGNHCKHLVFVFLKVLSVPETSTYYYQKALLTSELAEIFTSAPAPPTITANNRVVLAFAQAIGKAETSEQGAAQGPSRREVDGEDCPICYEAMKGKTPEDLAEIVFCDTCNNGLHTDCFKAWALKRPVTCVYCRALVEVDAGPGGIVHNGGYLNLAKEAGVSRARDTSSYYHGVIAGRKWHERYNYDD